jgi:hypothetical protein
VTFGLTSGDVHVRNTGLTGYAWAANHGWINLSPTTGGVTNDGSGHLGGWAWGEQLGWISFTGVTIDANGRFHGQATGNGIGVITFDCNYCDVRTDWRPGTTSSGASGSIQQILTTEPSAPIESSIGPNQESKGANPNREIFGESKSNGSASNGEGSAMVRPAFPGTTPTVPEQQFPTSCEFNSKSPDCTGYCASHPMDRRCPVSKASLITNLFRSVGKFQNNLTKLLVTPEAKVINGATTVLVVPVVTAVRYSQLGLVSIGNLSELRLVLLQLSRTLLMFLGLRRKRRYWGTVFDSVTKQPLDPVVVELLDVQTGERVEQSITDLMGRFGFLGHQGTFRLTAKKTHYRFPAKPIVGSIADEVFEHPYYGEPITLTGSEIVAPNIPMDPLQFDWNQADKQRFIKFRPRRERNLSTTLRHLPA